jgi:hypothetical protein
MLEKRSLRVSRGRHNKLYETVYHLHLELFPKSLASSSLKIYLSHG